MLHLYIFEPSPIYFDEPIEVKYELDEAEVNDKNFKWCWFDPDSQEWIPVPTFYDSVNQELVGIISHFSYYAVKQVSVSKYTPSSYSSINFSPRDTNISVNEARGSVYLQETEMTLYGPGDSSFTLTRSLSSEAIAMTDYSKWTNHSLPGFTSETQEYLLYAAGTEWKYNIPYLQGNRIYFEDGSSLSYDPLKVGESSYNFEGNIYEIKTSSLSNNGTVNIEVKTGSGRIYQFNNIPQSEAINDKNKLINIITFNDDKFVYCDTHFLRIADAIIYPDGHILNIAIADNEQGVSLNWNDDTTNIIQIVTTDNENSVYNPLTHDMVIYEYMSISGKKINKSYSNSTISVNERLLIEARYTNTQLANYDEEYVVNYYSNIYKDISGNLASRVDYRVRNSLGKVLRFDFIRSTRLKLLNHTGLKIFSNNMTLENKYVYDNSESNDDLLSYEDIDTNTDIHPVSRTHYQYTEAWSRPSWRTGLFKSTRITHFDSSDDVVDTEEKWFNRLGYTIAHRTSVSLTETEYYDSVISKDESGLNDFEKIRFSNNRFVLNPSDDSTVTLDITNLYNVSTFYLPFFQSIKSTRYGYIVKVSGLQDLPDYTYKFKYNDTDENIDLNIKVTYGDAGSENNEFLVSPNNFPLFTVEGIAYYLSTDYRDLYLLRVKDGGANSHRVSRVTTRQIDENGAMGEALVREYDYDDYGRIRQQVETSMDGSVIMDYHYDDYQSREEILNDVVNSRSPSTIVTSTKDNDSIQSLVRTVEIEYDQVSRNIDYVLKKPIINTIRDADNEIVRQEIYTYNNTNNKIDTIQIPGIRTTRYDYDMSHSNDTIESFSIYNKNNSRVYREFMSYIDGTSLISKSEDANRSSSINYTYDYLWRPDTLTTIDSENDVQLTVDYDYNDNYSLGVRPSYTMTITDSSNNIMQKEEYRYFNGQIIENKKFGWNDDENQFVSRSLEYDALQRIASETDFMGNEYQYHYNNLFFSSLDKPDDIDGRQISNSQSYSFVNLSIIDLDDSVHNCKYLAIFKDNEENRTSITLVDEKGNELFNGVRNDSDVISFSGDFSSYDLFGNVVKLFTRVVLVVNAGQYSVDLSNNLGVKYTQYDAVGQVENISEHVHSGYINTTSYEYDLAGNVVKVEESTNAEEFNDVMLTTETIYNGTEKPQRITKYSSANPSNTRVKIMYYDTNQNLTKVIEPEFEVADGSNLAVETRFIYDDFGRVVQEITNPSYPNARVKFFVYDELNRVVYEYDSRAAKRDDDNLMLFNSDYSVVFDDSKVALGVHYEYNKLGLLSRTTHPDGLFETFKYDENGNTLTETNKLGGVSNYYYDGLNRCVLSITDDMVKFVRYNRDDSVTRALAPGVVTGIATPLEQSFIDSTTLTTLNNLIDQDSNSIKYYYDMGGRINRIVDVHAGEERRKYNLQGLLQSSVLKTGAINNINYLENSSLVKTQETMTDNGSILSYQAYQYDWRGLVTSEFNKESGSAIRSYRYNEAGQITHVVGVDGDFENPIAKYIYQDSSLLDRVVYNDNREEVYQYDNYGNIVREDVSAGNMSMVTECQYDRVTGVINSVVRTNYLEEELIDQIEEGFQYDVMGENVDYNVSGSIFNGYGVSRSLSFHSESINDDQNRRRYILMPGTDKYLVYNLDQYGRYTSIGPTVNNRIAYFELSNGHVEDTYFGKYHNEYSFDVLGRVSSISYDYTNNSVTTDLYNLNNTYEDILPKTGNLETQVLNVGGREKTFIYSYDQAGRLTEYDFEGLNSYTQTNGNEQERNLYRNDYMLSSAVVSDDNFWLMRADQINPDSQGYEPVVRVDQSANVTPEQVNDNSTRYVIDSRSSSLEIVFKDEGASAVKWISIASSERYGYETWYSIYYKLIGQDNYIKFDSSDYTFSYAAGRASFILNETIDVKAIKVQFHRDDIDSLPFFSEKSMSEYHANNERPGLNRLSDGYQFEGDEVLTANLSEVVKVFALQSSFNGQMAWDEANRRTELRENGGSLLSNSLNQGIGYETDDKEDRIVRQGANSYLYDNFGRRVVYSSPEGTYIYRYGLNNTMTHVYYSEETHDVGSTLFDDLKMIDGSIDYVSNRFALIEVNGYNTSGIRIYKWSDSEESLYYRTPFGYMGKKDLISGDTRYLVNDQLRVLFEISNTELDACSLDNGVVAAKRIDGSSGTKSISVINYIDSDNVKVYHYDNIGSVRAVSQAGEIIWSADYLPFGDMLIAENTTDIVDATWLPLNTFAGHEHDAETGLIYAQMRWLDQTTGQFITEDPVKDGSNWYGYCSGNPVNMVDPTGLYFGIDDFIVAMVGLAQGDVGKAYAEYYGHTWQFFLGGPIGIIGGTIYEIGDYLDNDIARSIGLAFTGFGLGGITGSVNGAYAGYYDIYDFTSKDFFGNGIGACFIDTLDLVEFFTTYGYLAWGADKGGTISKTLSKGSGELWMTGAKIDKINGFNLGHGYVVGYTEEEMYHWLIKNDSSWVSPRTGKARTGDDKWWQQWQSHERTHSMQSRLFGVFYYAAYGIQAWYSSSLYGYPTDVGSDAYYNFQKHLHDTNFWELWALYYYPQK